MPTFLSDPPDNLYLILFAVVLATGVFLLRTRKRIAKILFVFALVLLLLLALFDWFFQSPREEAVDRVKAISAAIDNRKWDELDDHFSSQFDYRGKKAKDMKASFAALASQEIGTRVWQFDRDKVIQNGDNEVTIFFDAKGKSNNGEVYKHFKAVFIRDPDGKFRMKTLAMYDYIQKSKGQEETFPGF